MREFLIGMLTNQQRSVLSYSDNGCCTKVMLSNKIHILRTLKVFQLKVGVRRIRELQLDENVVVARVDPEIFHKRGLLRRKVEGVDKKMFLKKYVVDLYVRKKLTTLDTFPLFFFPFVCLFCFWVLFFWGGGHSCFLFLFLKIQKGKGGRNPSPSSSGSASEFWFLLGSTYLHYLQRMGQENTIVLLNLLTNSVLHVYISKSKE